MGDCRKVTKLNLQGFKNLVGLILVNKKYKDALIFFLTSNNNQPKMFNRNINFKTQTL